MVWAQTIRFHPALKREDIPSLSTIWLVLLREGLVTAPPRSRAPRRRSRRSRPDRRGRILRELALDPSRDYQPLRWQLVSTMSCDISLRCLETRHLNLRKLGYVQRSDGADARRVPSPRHQRHD